MKIKVQIPTKGHHPAKNGWFDTDKGNLYWFLYEEEWSCRDDRVSSEYPTWWLEDLANVPQANELLPPVIGRLKLQPKTIEQWLIDNENEQIKDDLGLTGQWNISVKDITDLIIDLA